MHSFGPDTLHSTPPSAIFYGAGYVSVIEMIRTGFALDVIGAIAIWLATLWFIPTMLELIG